MTNHIITYSIRAILLISLCFSLIFVVTAQDETSTPQPELRPIPLRVTQGEGIDIEWYFTSLLQGNVGLVRLVGDDVTNARIVFRDKEYPFFEVEDDAWYALLVADIDAQPREYQVSVIALKEDGTLASSETIVTVENAGYPRQAFQVPGDRAFLIDPLVERNEFARLFALSESTTPEPLWDVSGFELPMDAPITDSFGGYRILNDSVLTRHTGWDQLAAVGTPVSSIASGTVIFASRLDIRGNYVMIDHGWGVYSGYAHFSQLNVQAGQSVEAGQIIGLSGNTGRSSGPHLHWEIAINGEWIDSLAFLEMWLPVVE